MAGLDLFLPKGMKINEKKSLLCRDIEQHLQRLKRKGFIPLESNDLIFINDKHEAKYMVLQCAADVLNEVKPIDSLLAAMNEYPLYNKALLSSKTKQLVSLAVKADVKYSDDPKLAQLLIKLQSHQQKMQSKSGDVHVAKTAVLKAAIEYLKAPLEQKEAKKSVLNKAIKENPLYDKAFIKSKVESLVERTIEVMSNSPSLKP